jgi:hypothetical protein
MSMGYWTRVSGPSGIQVPGPQASNMGYPAANERRVPDTNKLHTPWGGILHVGEESQSPFPHGVGYPPHSLVGAPGVIMLDDIPRALSYDSRMAGTAEVSPEKTPVRDDMRQLE